MLYIHTVLVHVCTLYNYHTFAKSSSSKFLGSFGSNPTSSVNKLSHLLRLFLYPSHLPLYHPNLCTHLYPFTLPWFFPLYMSVHTTCIYSTYPFLNLSCIMYTSYIWTTIERERERQQNVVIYGRSIALTCVHVHLLYNEHIHVQSITCVNTCAMS